MRSVESLQETSGDKSAKHARERDSSVIQAVAAAELALAVPGGEQEEYAGREAGFEYAEDEAQAGKDTPAVGSGEAH